jgi:hypothetical protein
LLEEEQVVANEEDLLEDGLFPRVQGCLYGGRVGHVGKLKDLESCIEDEERTERAGRYYYSNGRSVRGDKVIKDVQDRREAYHQFSFNWGEKQQQSVQSLRNLRGKPSVLAAQTSREVAAAKDHANQAASPKSAV